MKLIIAGSRRSGLTDGDCEKLMELKPGITEVVSGSAQE